MLKRRLKVNKNMDYLFLRRHRRTATSNRQKSLLLKAAERQWELQFANKGTEGRKVDCALYKCILYNDVRVRFEPDEYIKFNYNEYEKRTTDKRFVLDFM